MSKINLKSFVSEQSDVVIFNGGDAGRVKDVTVEVTKKTPQDKPESPDYKINFYDDNGGTVNLGVFYPNERTKETEVHIRVNQLLSVLQAVNPTLDPETLPEFDTVEQSYDYLCNAIRKAAPGVKCNIFVTYGTKRNPSKYLGFRAYNIVESADTPDGTTRLVPVSHPEGHKKADYNDNMSRVQPTDIASEMDAQTPETTTEGSEETW